MNAATPIVRALSCHATYACGNSGACCSAGWPIPVEGHVLPVLTHAVASGRVTPLGGAQPVTVPDERPADVAALLGRDASGACVFFDRAHADGCCRVQRGAGHMAMPLSCRQFPRLVRHGPGCTDVSLSHWCPTALRLLDADGPVRIEHEPPAFTDGAHLEGLDARETWPPLLTPTRLCDLDAYYAIEAATVDLLANGRGTPVHRLAIVAALYERLRRWHPSEGPHLEQVHAVLARPASGSPQVTGDDDLARLAPSSADRLWRALLEAIPPAARWRVPAACLAAPTLTLNDVDACDVHGRLGRYLAARAFGAWIAYQGHGLRSVLAGLAAALVAVERSLGVAAADADPRSRVSTAIRTADLLLLHLGSPDALAVGLRPFEDQPVVFSASA